MQSDIRLCGCLGVCVIRWHLATDELRHKEARCIGGNRTNAFVLLAICYMIKLTPCSDPEWDIFENSVGSNTHDDSFYGWMIIPITLIPLNLLRLYQIGLYNTEFRPRLIGIVKTWPPKPFDIFFRNISLHCELGTYWVFFNTLLPHRAFLRGSKLLPLFTPASLQ